MPAETGLKRSKFIPGAGGTEADWKPGQPPESRRTVSGPAPLCLPLPPSVKRSNCYMVCGGDVAATSQRGRSNVDLEIGCLVDLAMGMLSFSANGRELGTCYQVGKGRRWAEAGAPSWVSAPGSPDSASPSQCVQ